MVAVAALAGAAPTAVEELVADVGGFQARVVPICTAVAAPATSVLHKVFANLLAGLLRLR